jgi:hypothetical protein
MKFKITSLIILLIISNAKLNAFGGGKGTEDEPYQISTKAHLTLLADSVNTLGSAN